MLCAADAFGINTDQSEHEVHKALLTVCLQGALVFVSESLPIQYVLDDGYIHLFCVPEAVSRPTGQAQTLLEAGKADERLPERTTGALAEETKQDQVETGVRENNSRPAPRKLQKPRLPFKDYAATKSIETIKRSIGERVVDVGEIKLQGPISTLPRKLGTMHTATYRDMGQLAVRIIEFAKLPSYVLEDVYLELCYRAEHSFEDLVPITGVACESPKLYLLMPKQELSLHQYIYEKMGDANDRLHTILYCYP